MENRAFYQAGLQHAVEDIYLGMFSDESLIRSAEIFDSLQDLPTIERLQHAMLAALGYRLVGEPGELLTPVPFDQGNRVRLRHRPGTPWGTALA